MKKWLAIILVLVILVASLASCNKGKGSSSGISENTSSQSGGSTNADNTGDTTSQQADGADDTSAPGNEPTTKQKTSENSKTTTTRKQSTTTKAVDTATTTAEEEVRLKIKNSDIDIVAYVGSWMAVGDTFQVFADASKTYWAMSDTYVAPGKAFTYEFDVSTNDPKKYAQVMMYFGSANSDAIKWGAYDLRLGFKDNLMRIFYVDENLNITRFGEVKQFTDEEMAQTKFHVKLQMSASGEAKYYLNGKLIDTVQINDFKGGYFGLGTWGTSATFSNIKVKIG